MDTKPQQLKYSENLRYTSIGAKEEQSNFVPKNGSVFSYDKNRIIKFNLAGSGMLSCRESYLKFDIRNNSATDIEVSPTAGAHGCFSRYITKMDNKIIDDIMDYSHFMAVVSDFKMSEGHKNSFGTISGYAKSSVTTSNPLKDVVGDLRIANRRSYDDDTYIVPAGEARTLCIPLQGVLQSSKYIPMHFLQSLEFELHLNNVATAYTSDALVDDDEVEYTNFEYVADLIEVEAGVLLQMEQALMSPAGITVSANTWKNSQYHVASNTGNYVYPIAEKWSSIKSILVSQRNSDTYYGGAPTLDRNHRVYDDVSSLQLQVGSKYYPTQPLELSKNSAEPIVQVLKSLGNSLHDYKTSSTVDLDNFYLTGHQIRFVASAPVDSVTYNASPVDYDELPKKLGKFVAAFDMETYSENKAILSGVNNAERNLTISMHIKRNGVVDNLLVSTFCHIDQDVVLKIDPMSRVLSVDVLN